MKTIKSISIAIMLLVCFSHIAKSKTIETQSVKASTEVLNQKKCDDLIVRLDEINAVDKSSMSFSEKRKLRTEVRKIKQQLHASSGGGGLYISGGALIIIVILLIVLL